MQKVVKILIILKVSINLGINNVLSVLFYRFLLKSSLLKIIFPQKNYRKLNFFIHSKKSSPIITINESKILIDYADKILKGELRYFSYKDFKVGYPPKWFLNPFNNKFFPDTDFHWSRLKDFNDEIGDIKCIWEPSRFHWVGTLGIAYASTKDAKYLEGINKMLIDWNMQNPQNSGPNWKCGQEISLRLINLVLLIELLHKDQISNDVIDFLVLHVDRIYLTKFYAKAQDNNHIIIELVALYFTCHFLFNQTSKKRFKKMHDKSRILLEDCIQRLILNDGTFSQYSMIYHRMVLDILSFFELFRKRWKLKKLENEFYEKVYKAIDWYESMIDPISGNAPNLGGNDGTYLFNFDNKEYRDFRPSLNLASAIFEKSIKKKYYAEHIFQIVFNKKTLIEKVDRPLKTNFFEGGFLKLIRKNGSIILRYPKYKFRPAHSDALHVDVWQDGINLIKDAGSFSYAEKDKVLDLFAGARGHSTVIFENKSQMPKISRFLYGSWLKAASVVTNSSNTIISSEYKSGNNSHKRTIKKTSNGWIIEDKILGDFKFADIQFILNPTNWILKKNKLIYNNVSIEIQSLNFFKISLHKQFESLYYMNKGLVTVLKVGINEEGIFNTYLNFN